MSGQGNLFLGCQRRRCWAAALVKEAIFPQGGTRRVEADEVLNERLDKLAVQFKSSQPTFFNEYTTARLSVCNPGGRAKKDEKTVALPSTNVSLPEAA